MTSAFVKEGVRRSTPFRSKTASRPEAMTAIAWRAMFVPSTAEFPAGPLMRSVSVGELVSGIMLDIVAQR
jgi:hypothetical protein